MVYKSRCGLSFALGTQVYRRLPIPVLQRAEFMSQREIIDALEEELSVSARPLKFTVSEVKQDGSALFKIFINFIGDSTF